MTNVSRATVSDLLMIQTQIHIYGRRKMNPPGDNKRLLRRIALLPLAVYALTGVAQEVEINLEEVPVTPWRTIPPRPVDLDARSDFTINDIVAQEYLVVTVTIEANDIIADTIAALVRGPKKASGLVDDLRVTAYSGSSVEAVYAMADPRIVRYQAGDRFTLGHKTEIKESSRSKVYIPLDPAIDKVTIRPSPGSRPGVSKGGEFNPKQSAIAACRIKDRARFPACNGFFQLTVNP